MSPRALDRASIPEDRWLDRALRGTAVRAGVCAPLAALVGALTSWPQAFYTAGLCAGLVAVLSGGERWLTRAGPLSRGRALQAGLVACALVAGAATVFALQIHTNFAERVWTEGPTAAFTALYEAATRKGPAAFLALWVLSLPVGVSASCYLRTRENVHLAEACAIDALAVAGVLGCGSALILPPGPSGRLFTVVGAAMGLFLVVFVGSYLLLVGVLLLEALERWAWGGKSTRWAPPSSQPGPEAGPNPADPGPCAAKEPA